jgi:hypothetical protein
MAINYPSPDDVGISIPPNLITDRFEAGFRHGLEGRTLNQVPHLRKSFREGFRAAKLYLRWLRRQNGVLEFPARHHMKTSVG